MGERIVPRVERLMWLQNFLKERIKHEEFSLSTVLSSMEEGVLVADGRLVIRLANPAFVEGFGLQSMPLERSVLEVLGEAGVHRLLNAALESGESREEQLELLPGKRMRVVNVRAVPMRDMRGRPGVLAVFRDITRLNELELVRREFVANVSHELRTPLAIFQGYVETLIDLPDMSLEERNEAYSVLRRHSARLNALVEDLLTIARLESKREKFRLEASDLARLLTLGVQDWRARTQGREVDVQVESSGPLPQVRIDRFRIEQVLHNLLDNAFKHLPAQGGKIRVCVSLQSEAQRVRVVVEDNGSGIAEQDLPHIFERFYRGDKSRTSGGGSGPHSTGLGLSIVKHIIVEHGGTVGADSTSGKGASVWFCLPVFSAEQAAA
jgi:two-component system phosphate regulon sensor histidine kinase PhoR